MCIVFKILAIKNMKLVKNKIKNFKTKYDTENNTK